MGRCIWGLFQEVIQIKTPMDPTKPILDRFSDTILLYLIYGITRMFVVAAEFPEPSTFLTMAPFLPVELQL